MATLRLPESVWAAVHQHLFGTPGEHFAFLLARCADVDGEPVFLVHDMLLVPDAQIAQSRHGWELSLDGILAVVNAAVRGGFALIEAHGHGGRRPRFSGTDRQGLPGFAAYMLGSLPGRPYGATVWGDTAIYGEVFLPDGQTTSMSSITVAGSRLLQLASCADDEAAIEETFARQLPWFATEGQRALGRLRAALVGVGGTGAQLAQNLVYLGVRDFVLVDDDTADPTSMNRLVTAAAADIGTPKTLLARRLIKSVAPAAQVTTLTENLRSPAVLTALKGVDVVFGCVDNDGARLILNELAVAYALPYIDLGVGIEVEDSRVTTIGGRVAIVVPGGPCLVCMGEIDRAEAAFMLGTPEQQAFQRERGYVHGMDVPAPAVVSLNATLAATAATEFAVYVSGLRPVQHYTELDVLGTGRSLPSQWLTPRRVVPLPGCVHCALAGSGDTSNLERYLR